MSETPSYQQGQRWEFADGIPEFENTLVIGHVYQPRPELGTKGAEFQVYIRFAPIARSSIRPHADGIILELTDKGLDQSLTRLVESNVELPWWWRYGRRFDNESDATGGVGVICTDRVASSLDGEWKRETQAAERERHREASVQEHLRRYGNIARRVPSRSVAESWQRIVAWHSEVKGWVPNLNEGASEIAIASFEKEIGLKLPDEFKESLRIHDGGAWSIPGGDGSRGEFLTLEGVLEQWRMYKEWQEQGDYAIDNDDWIPREISGPIKSIFWNVKRIPVTDNSGDHLMLDLDPPEDGTYGQVLDHSHEVGPECVLAPSWSAYLSQLVDELESGKYIWFEFEGELEPFDWETRRPRYG